MALQVCAGCSAAFAVGLSACPQCGSTDWSEETPMPKITIHGGATNDAEAVAPDEGAAVPEAPEEESSPGNSSETSSPKAEPSEKPSGSKGRSRARTTENPS